MKTIEVKPDNSKQKFLVQLLGAVKVKDGLFIGDLHSLKV